MVLGLEFGKAESKQLMEFCVFFHQGNNLLYTRKTVTSLSDTRSEVEVGTSDVGTTWNSMEWNVLADFSLAWQVPGKQGKKPFRVAMEVWLRWYQVVVCVWCNTCLTFRSCILFDFFISPSVVQPPSHAKNTSMLLCLAVEERGPWDWLVLATKTTCILDLNSMRIQRFS